MFSPDVVSLKQFYHSPIGRRAKRHISSAIAYACSNTKTKPEKEQLGSLLAMGYSLPYLPYFEQRNEVILPLMPAEQGAIYYPTGDYNRTILVDNAMLPLPESSFDNCFVMHCLEHCREPKELLKSLWHTLTPGGKMLIIVPNRRSIWSQAGSTPFGCGQPFNMQQLRKLTEEAGFTHISSQTALHMPPLNWRINHKLSKAWEFLGKMFLPRVWWCNHHDSRETNLCSNQTTFNAKSGQHKTTIPNQWRRTCYKASVVVSTPHLLWGLAKSRKNLTKKPTSNEMGFRKHKK